MNASLIADDGQTLSAFITVPAGESIAAVLILQGSGNVGADGDVSGPFLGRGYRGQPAKVGEQMAETLARAQIASIRYHKRGFENAAELPHQTLEYLEKDARSALALLRSRFPEKKLGILGYSEGALVALKVAAQESVDALFLFAPPTESIDSFLKYQFREYPLKLLRERYDQKGVGILSGDELTVLTATGLPGLDVLGVKWPTLDPHQTGLLSIEEQIAPAYDAGLKQVMTIVNSTMKPWYDSMKALPSFSLLAEAVKKTPVFYYQGLQDPQVDGVLAQSASREFLNLKSLRLYPEYGHGFTFLEGVHGELKTTGPYQPCVLNDLTLDLKSAFFPLTTNLL